MGRRVSKSIALMDAFRPVNDHGSSNATFVYPGFMQAKRSVGSRGPAGPKAKIGIGRTGLCANGMLIGPVHDFGTGTIIGAEKDNGILKISQLLQGIDITSNLPVHSTYHGCMNGHFCGLKIFLFFS